MAAIHENEWRRFSRLGGGGRREQVAALVRILTHFAIEQKLTVNQARRLQCTAEHLCARKNGGGDTAVNIAAACLFCNRHRHIRKAELTPEQFQVHVSKRMACGGWHP